MGRAKYEKDYNEEILWYGRRCRFGLPLSFTRYILTPTKLYSKIGFLNIKEERVDLYRVVDYSLRLPLVQRIFGCGTVTVHSKDKTETEQVLLSIKRPREALRLLEEYVEQQRVKYGIHGRDMIGASGIDGNFGDFN